MSQFRFIAVPDAFHRVGKYLGGIMSCLSPFIFTSHRAIEGFTLGLWEETWMEGLSELRGVRWLMTYEEWRIREMCLRKPSVRG
jgi:hypothetical protein